MAGIVALGMSIADAFKKPDTPKPPAETAIKGGIEAKRMAARAQGLSSTIIAGRTRAPLGLPSGGPTPAATA